MIGKRAVLLIASALVLQSCIKTRVVQCPIQTIADKAIEQELTLSRILNTDAECDKDQLREAYSAALATRCGSARAWQDGLTGKTPNSLCEADLKWREGFNLGRDYGNFQAELKAVEQRLENLAGDTVAPGGQTGRAKMERLRLIREMDAIRGAAAIHGWPVPEED